MKKWLTLTLDVFKCFDNLEEYEKRLWLTLTLDVFKSTGIEVYAGYVMD